MGADRELGRTAEDTNAALESEQGFLLPMEHRKGCFLCFFTPHTGIGFEQASKGQGPGIGFEQANPMGRSGVLKVSDSFRRFEKKGRDPTSETADNNALSRRRLHQDMPQHEQGMGGAGFADGRVEIVGHLLGTTPQFLSNFGMGTR